MSNTFRMGVPDLPLPKNIITEAPVVSPNNITNAIGIATAISPILLWLANYFEVPITESDIGIVMSAVGIVAGVFMWVKNRYFSNAVTVTSALRHGMKMSLKYDDGTEETR